MSAKKKSVAILLEEWPAPVVKTVLELLEDMSTYGTANGQVCTRDDRAFVAAFTADAADMDYLHAAFFSRIGQASEEERARYRAARSAIKARGRAR